MSIKARFDQISRNIRPTEKHIIEANRQTNFMIERLKDKVSSDGSFKLEKVLKAGSNAKFTSLLKTEDNIFDVDLGVYFSGEGATKRALDRLLQFTCDQVRAIYGNTKDDDDFQIKKSAVWVKFRGGIKLNVDLAPIIRDDSLGIENGGWLPRLDGWRLTSVTCHNQFVATRTARSNTISGPVKFNRLVRMFKWWNNRQENCQPSIFCDLVTAAAFEQTGVTSEWQSSLLRIFSYLRKHQFCEPIIFSDYYDAKKVTLPNDKVIMMDSVNSTNNVACTWTEAIRTAYVEHLQEAYDAMMDARSHELDDDEDGAVNHWCRVFGEKFRTLSEAEEED